MRPSVLIVEPDDERRRDLGNALAEDGYEVIPAASVAEGVKFARGLGPSVVVGGAELPGFADGSIVEQFEVSDGAAIPRTLVRLGRPLAGPTDGPSQGFIAVDGRPLEEVARSIQLLLVGRELGVDSDSKLRYLIGDLNLFPMLELLRALGGCQLTGQLQLPQGAIAFAKGQVVAARLDNVRGEKAVCRLCRATAGPFRVFIGPTPGAEVEIETPLETLLVHALEESQQEFPDPRTRLVSVPAERTPSGELTRHELLLAQVIDRAHTLGETLDSINSRDGMVLKALQKLLQRGAVRLEAPKVAVKIVTDSTCDLPPEIARNHDILVVPLTVIFGKSRFRDGVEIQARDFYEMLMTDEHHPSTEPPTEAEIYEHYDQLIRDQDILSVHISGKMSETQEHARQAALRGIRSFQHLPERRHNFALEVIDSQTVSAGLGMQAIFAARMAMRGETVFAIANRLREIAPRLHLLFAVDSFDSLLKGGRIGKAKAMVGKLLSIKPILGVVDGEVMAVARARGSQRVQPKIVDLVSERIDPRRPLVVCIAHSRAPVPADRLRQQMEKTFQIRELFLTDIGPVVGTHTGPGCVGTVVFQPTDEEWALLSPVS